MEPSHKQMTDALTAVVNALLELDWEHQQLVMNAARTILETRDTPPQPERGEQ